MTSETDYRPALDIAAPDHALDVCGVSEALALCDHCDAAAEVIAPGAKAWRTEANIAKARALWDEGLIASEIARHIGGDCTKDAITSVAHRRFWTKRPSPIKPRDLAQDGRIHRDRLGQGRDPLPAGHPISAGAIAL